MSINPPSNETAPNRGNGKSVRAFRTISEVASDLEVPQHVLRFWETKFSYIKPMKRGGGRRNYRPEDVALLRRIRDLLYTDGFTIKGVQRLLRENGVRSLLNGRTTVVETTHTQHKKNNKRSIASMDPAPKPLELSNEHRSELQSILKELNELKTLLQP